MIARLLVMLVLALGVGRANDHAVEPAEMAELAPDLDEVVVPVAIAVPMIERTVAPAGSSDHPMPRSAELPSVFRPPRRLFDRV